MNAGTIAATTLGGLGLFLFGMSLMTDGLKLAAGPALTRILAAATRTRAQALGAGMLVTALVQSSSAITVATIGFVNAGVLGLGAALWVLFGANVGTTMTGWIVAMVGLKFDIQALALPLIGVGALLKLTGERSRRAALGEALAGFGLLFLGISMLQSAFTGLAGQVSLPQGEGAWAVLAQLAVGLAMTVLMQSSSASIAIALTAAQGGLIPLHGAAAVVIGANIGTTVTALLATLGATPNAKRAAAAHVVFNAITGTVALALLPWLVDELAGAARALELGEGPAVVLALFHTTFNVLGVLLMWPLADRLTRWLDTRFQARDEQEARPRYLDDTVLAVPELAVQAVEAEVARLGQITLGLARDVLAGGSSSDPGSIEARHAVVTQLDQAITDFAERLNRDAMTPATSAQLARVLRVERYHETVAERALEAAALGSTEGDAAKTVCDEFVRRADALLVLCSAPGTTPDQLSAALDSMEIAYEGMKSGLLLAGAEGRLRLGAMEETLRRFSALRRAAQQAAKAARLTLSPVTGPDAGTG